MIRLLFLASLLLSAAGLSAQTPQGRILKTFAAALDYHEPFLETETMIVAAQSYRRTEPGHTGEEWLKVMFWDKDGSNYSERSIPKGYGAATGGKRCFAYGNEIFLPSGGSYHAVNRDPSVAMRWMGYLQDTLCEITDDHLIVRIEVEQDDDGILFQGRHDGVVGGRVETTLRVQQLVARENDIVFTSRDTKGQFRFHRMAHPDFSGEPVVKAKITNFPGAYSGVSFFGEDFAVVDIEGIESIIRYSDPAKGGKPGVYRVTEPYNSAQWVEQNGTLARWVSSPAASLSHVEFGNGSYTLKPLGLPAGLLGSRYLSAGDSGIYVTSPAYYGGPIKPADWVYRLDFAPGRSLVLDHPVADESDGKLRFTATLDRPATQAVTFNYETMGGSASSSTDFTAVSGAVTIPVGQTVGYVDVPLMEDLTIERPETLDLRITAVQGALCDSPVVTGRIRGSGARMLEQVANDPAGTVTGTLDPTNSRENPVRSVIINGRLVESRPLGFEGFWPVADDIGGFRYVRAIPLGSDTMKLCQFDATTGDLMEVFDHAPFKRQGGELIIAKGTGYVRYGFYDGFPVISLDGIQPVEDGGFQTFTAKSERTTRDIAIAAQWSAPTQSSAVSFVLLPSGDYSFNIYPDDDQKPGLGLPLGLALTLTEAGNPASPGAMIANVTIQDDDVVHTTFVSAETILPNSIAASGNRLWMGRINGAALESFDFAGGTLKPGPKAALPKGVRLISNNYERHGAGQALSYDGSRLVVSADQPLGSGLLTYTAAGGGNAPKGKFLTTQMPGTSQVATSSYSISSNTVPGSSSSVVQIRNLKNKLVRELRPDASQGQTFGYAMAVAGDTLWIASPGAGSSGGRVDGYLLSNFSLVATLVSPDPVDDGAFGYAMAAHGSNLVIGEPSNTAPGAAWVFSANGATLHKRLGSGQEDGPDGFGSQVATRNGRVLVGAGRVEWLDAPAGFTVQDHSAVLLWTDLEAEPLRLVPSTADEPGYVSGHRIALLDGCAVMAAGSITAGGLEYHAFPAASAAPVSTEVARVSAGTIVPVWPAEGAPDPVWSITRTGDGGAEVVVKLGGIPADPTKVLLEWSPDLVRWEALGDAAGTSLSGSNVVSITAGEGALKLVTPPGAPDNCFFRLRSKE